MVVPIHDVGVDFPLVATKKRSAPVTLSIAEFEERFPLVANPFEDAEPAWENEDGEGCVFETYGEQLAFVRARDPLEIWTIMDDDTIQSGYHTVNRLNYLVSSVKRAPGADFVVTVEAGQDE